MIRYIGIASAACGVLLLGGTALAAESELAMSVVGGGGFVRAGMPMLIMGLGCMCSRRQRQWYEDPALLENIEDLPSLPQDYMYYPRA